MAQRGKPQPTTNYNGAQPPSAATEESSQAEKILNDSSTAALGWALRLFNFGNYGNFGTSGNYFASHTVLPPTTVLSTRILRISGAGTLVMSRSSTTKSASIPGTNMPFVFSANSA